MEIRVLTEEENKLFNRMEIRFEVVHEGESTPKLLDVKRLLAQKIGADATHVIIDGFKTLFGIGRSVGDARVYKNMSELKDYEPMYLLKRNKVIKEEKPEEDKEEKPVEAKPEEKKPEQKEEVKPKEVKEGEGGGKEEKSS